MSKANWFKPGNKTGRLGGRPLGSGRIQIAKEWVDKYGWKKLMDMAEGKLHYVGTKLVKDKNGKKKRVKRYEPYSQQTQEFAIQTLAHYGHGKPVTAIELSGNEGGDVNFNVTVKKFG